MESPPMKKIFATRNLILALVIALCATSLVLQWGQIADFVKLAMPMALTLIVGALREMRESKQAVPRKDLLLGVPAAFLILLAVLVLIEAALTEAAIMYAKYVHSRIVERSGDILTVMGTLLVGGMLFLFRQSYRALYGLTEVLAGVSVALSREHSPDANFHESSFYLALLTAGVYLVVRGLDNIGQGIDGPAPDPAVTWLLRKSKLRSTR